MGDGVSRDCNCLMCEMRRQGIERCEEREELVAEIETLEDEREQILGMIQTRLQPDGSPPSGGPVALVSWITNAAWQRVADLERQLADFLTAANDTGYSSKADDAFRQVSQAVIMDLGNFRAKCALLEQQLAEARKQTERLLNIARGCHDYGGGYSGTTNAKIYHHGIQTVITALEAASREDTLQTRVLESVGRNATAAGRRPRMAADYSSVNNQDARRVVRSL